MPALKRTPLYNQHERLGGKMVEFAGHELPVRYGSILDEHRAVREAAGLFDVSHMGQIGLEGHEAVAATDGLLTRAVSTLKPGRVRYALLCNEAGGVIDDVTAYRLADEALFLCVNAANTATDVDWVRTRLAGSDVTIRDLSAETMLLALQGPASAEVLAQAGVPQAAALRRFRFDRLELAGTEVLVSRTGYTGADGFELYGGAGDAERVFEALLTAGKPLGLLPCGLGARDTLRLEAALPLHGHEIDAETSPLEAGLGRFVDEDREFVGAEAIRRRAAAGATRALVGFVLEGRGVARAGYPVAVGGETVGEVTSGGPSPTLGSSIGLAYVPPALVAPGARFDVVIRDRKVPARVVETPFVRGEDAGRRTGR